MKKKIIFVVLILILVASAGIWLAFLNKKEIASNISQNETGSASTISASSTSPSQSTTTNSEIKTYQNDQFGFKFQYPDTTRIIEASSGTGTSTKLSLLIECDQLSYLECPFNEELHVKKTNLINFNNFAINYGEQFANNPPIHIIINESASVQGGIALLQEITFPPRESEGKIVYLYFIHNNALFTLISYGRKTDEQISLPSISKGIDFSTLQFTR